MSFIPDPELSIVAAWWPCDRCAGSHPGVDAFGHELPGPPVRLIGNDWLCGPCRGVTSLSVPKIVGSAA